MTKPYILITGDDSVRSEGIILIKRIVQEFADYQIVATKTQMSGVGAAMTFRGGPYGKETVDGDHEAIWVEGYPTDAVYFAFRYLDKKPDLVISGVNHGENVEDATMIRSGTIGAAHTASAARGVPTIAFSRRVLPGEWDKEHEGGFDDSLLEYPGKIIREVVTKALDYNFPKDSFWNVNFPPNPTETLKIVRTNFHGSYPNEQDYDAKRYWYDFEVQYTGWDEGTDAGEMERGYATLTPCKISFTIEDELDKLKSTFSKND